MQYTNGEMHVAYLIVEAFDMPNASKCHGRHGMTCVCTSCLAFACSDILYNFDKNSTKGVPMSQMAGYSVAGNVLSCIA